MNRVILNKIKYALYSPFEWVFLAMKGVRTKGKSYFLGLPTISRVNNSTIEIGARCIFNSTSDSNLIGISHKCIISTLEPGARINIGICCGFSGTSIGCAKSISIGNHVRCGANTLITDTDWHQDDPRSGECKPVVIEDNVWLGINSMVLKGVTIGRNSVIGAGSVVTKDIPANVIAAGNPCKVVKKIELKTIKILDRD